MIPIPSDPDTMPQYDEDEYDPFEDYSEGYPMDDEDQVDDWFFAEDSDKMTEETYREWHSYRQNGGC